MHEVHTLAEGASGPKLAVLSDGSVMIASGTTLTRVLAKAGPQKLLQFEAEISLLVGRPRRQQLLVRAGDQIMLVDAVSGTRKPLKLEPGQTGTAAWAPSGRSLIYLHIPDDPHQLITLRENIADENSDKLLAKTSQFQSASPNSDASVFTGASRSKASPYVLILLRAARRELTLCEHRASDPAMVQPAFSPDSQSVFFASDRHGKPALYRVHVEKFVEETEPA